MVTFFKFGVEKRILLSSWYKFVENSRAYICDSNKASMNLCVVANIVIKMVLGQVSECKKCAVSSIENQISYMCIFQNFSKTSEGDIREVLNCWKLPQDLVLECHKCPLVTRFKPRSWHPNRCLVPLTSSVDEQKWKGH